MKYSNQTNVAILGGRKRYLFLMPAFLVYVSIIVIPAFYSLFLSFHTWRGGKSSMVFVGLSNYIKVLTQDKTFLIAIKNNLIWVVLTLFCTVTIAMLLALLLNRDFRGRTIVRGVLYFPYILSGVIVGMIWTWVYQPQYGLYNAIMDTFNLSGLKHSWLADTNTSFLAVYVAAMWHNVGQPMVLFLAGLQSVPNELIEASKIDGATSIQSFWHITIPQLRETLFIVYATQFISAMKVYDIVKTMTNGGPAEKTNTLATLMVRQTFDFANFGVGAAISWIMIVILLIVIIPYVVKMSKE